MKANEIDTTSMDNTDNSKTSMPGDVDYGTVNVNVNFLPDGASHRAVITNLVSGATENYQIAWGDFGATALTATINTGTDVITTATHGLTTGRPIKLSTTGTLPTSTPQVKAGSIYFVGYQGTTTFKLYASNADAVAGINAIDFSTAGTGTLSVLSGTVWAITAFNTQVNPSGKRGDKANATLALKVSTAISFPA
jgi:hypothetical protein